MPRDADAVPPSVRSARARLTAALAGVLLISTFACLDDAPVAPSGGAVRLAIRAQVAPGPGERAIAIRVYYSRQDEQQVDLPVTPARVNVPRGATTTQALVVQISECLTDPLRIGGESASGCRLHVELRLLGSDGEFLSEQTQDVDASAPGQEVPVAPFNLPAASIALSAASVVFEAVEDDESLPAALTIAASSATGASLGTLSAEIEYPGDEEPVDWLSQSLQNGVLTLRPDRTDLYPGTYTAIVRISASREGVAPTTVAVTYTVSGRPRRLVVAGAGSGSATIVSEPAGIDCTFAFGRTNAGCSAMFAFGTQVTLTITMQSGFLWNWSGSCAGRGDCAVTMVEDQDVVANFAAPGGGDFVLLGDGNILDATAMANEDNQRLAANLVRYGTAGARMAATRVHIDCGRSSPGRYICPNGFGPFSTALAAVGFQSTIISSASGSITSVPADVKMLVLVMPCEPFTAPEVAALRTFAKEGGRILVVSEYESFYGLNWQTCSATQNQLARDLQTGTWLVGGAYDIGYHTLSASSLRSHQITAGMTSITMGYSSRVAADANADPLLYDSSNEVLIGAVSLVDAEPVIVDMLAPLSASLSSGVLRVPPLTPWSTVPSPIGR